MNQVVVPYHVKINQINKKPNVLLETLMVAQLCVVYSRTVELAKPRSS